MTSSVDRAEAMRTSTRRPRADCRSAPCPVCNERTTAYQTRPAEGSIRRVCKNGHRSIWRRGPDGKPDCPRLPLTSEQRRKRPDRYPLCAYEPCDRLRVVRGAGGGGYCYGHKKQKDRHVPLTPLLSADPRVRAHESYERRLARQQAEDAAEGVIQAAIQDHLDGAVTGS